MSALETTKTRSPRMRARRRALVLTAALTLTGALGTMLASSAHAGTSTLPPGVTIRR